MSTLVPPNNAIEISTFFTWMGNDGICRTITKDNAEINLDNAAENTKTVTSFYSNKKFPLFIDSRSIKSITRDARKHFSTNNRDTKINAMAIMVKSSLSRVIGNFFMGLNKPQVPARLFDDETVAINWLKQYL